MNNSVEITEIKLPVIVPCFQDGGGLGANAFYLERSSDLQLLQALSPEQDQIEHTLLQSRCCFVLGPRQSGKTSLCFRIANQLRQKQVHCAILSNAQQGEVGVSPETWFNSLAQQVMMELGIGDPWGGLPATWSKSRVSSGQDWLEFMEQVVLQEIHDAPVVLFYDEIDLLLNWPEVANEFFAALYSVQQRHDPLNPNDVFHRLTFCLVSGTVPWELANQANTLFSKNADGRLFAPGELIRLQDLSWEQISPMAEGLKPYAVQPIQLLRTVFDQTIGHPFHTQKLCAYLCDLSQRKKQPIPSGEEANEVETLVHELFLGLKPDSNIEYTRTKLFSPSKRSRVFDMLALYRQTLEAQKKRQGIAWQETNEVHIDLWLSGIATDRQNPTGEWMLCPRNPIFERVFEADMKEIEANQNE